MTLQWSRYPSLVALLVLVTLTTCMTATFLAGLILRTPSLQRTVANVGRLVPHGVLRSLPRPRSSGCRRAFPLTHGLDAVRELYGAARPDVVLGHAALEATVLVGWLVLAFFTFRRLADAGRRDGSIVFSTG